MQKGHFRLLPMCQLNLPSARTGGQSTSTKFWQCLLFIPPTFRFLCLQLQALIQLLLNLSYFLLLYFSPSLRQLLVHTPSVPPPWEATAFKRSSYLAKPTDGPTENCDESHWPSQSDRLTDRLTDQQIYIQTEFDRANKQNDILTRQ